MKIVKIVLFSIVFILMNACNLDKLKPTFEGAKNVSVDHVTKENITVSADLIFFNPNIFSIYISDMDIDVYIEGLEIANIKQRDKVEIKSKQSFDLPTTASFNPMQFFENDVIGLLNSLGSAFKNKEINLKYVGEASFEVKGLNFKIPINYSEKVEFQ